MINLFEQLENVEEGSRELDAEIHALVLGGSVKCPDRGGYIFVIAGIQHGVAALALPHYTTSLDDAIKLVPEGWSMNMSQDDKRQWWAELREGFQTSYDKVALASKLPTLALAICLAALRARREKE